MGLDCAFLTYLGKPMVTSELARLIENMLQDEGCADVLFLVHAKRQKKGLSPAFNCIGLFEGEEKKSKTGHKMQFSEDELRPLNEKLANEDRSLADLMKIAFKIARPKIVEEMKSAPLPTESENRALEKLAALLSRQTGAALFVGVFDHSCMGSYARYENGNRVDGRNIDDETYESAADAALAQFVGGEHLGVQRVYSELFEDANPETFQIVRSGALVKLEAASLRDIRQRHLESALT